MFISKKLHPRLLRTAAIVAIMATTSVGCASLDASTSETALVSHVTSTSEISGSLFDSEFVHSIEIEFDTEAYAALIETYETTGEKDWIEADLVIDGATLTNIGLRLKGNSSLRGLTAATAEHPEELPWLIRLDKYVDGQNYLGQTDIVIRSNSTETAMNEAVALDLLALAGLADEQAIATTFAVNGGEPKLRLAIEHPDEIWEDDNFDAEKAALYKADSEGDYSYRGDDPESYTDVFNQKVGDDDLEPLINFLEFINNSDDETFAAGLGDILDVEAFATYLAFQDLIGNFDDIDGPGNNSYLHYNYDIEQFTVVNWDLNLAFDTANVGGGGQGGNGGPGARPAGVADGQRPEREANVNGARGAGQAHGNVLSERFFANETFAAMVADAMVELRDSLFESGAAGSIVETWSDVLATSSADVVDQATIDAEAAAILNTIKGV